MDKLPEIKPEVLKEKEERKGGLLGGLLSKLGGGAGAGGAGAGGAGALGSAGSAALGGGLLATKAGLVALIVAGTSVAGGLGFVGWKAFGPGADGVSVGEAALQVFAPKPPSEAGAQDGASAAPKDGNSESLSMVAQANTAPAAAPAEPAAADATKVSEKDAVAGSAAASAAAASVGSGHANNTNVGGNRAGSLLAGAKKGFGQLSGIAGAGTGGTSATSSSGGTSAPARAANVGSASAFGAAGNATGRGLGIRKAGTKGGAFQQGMGINGQSHGASNLQAGGGQYFDGGTGSGRITGGNGGVALTGAGVGNGKGAAAANTPGPKGDSNPFQAPPTPTGKNVTPWQNALNTAMMLVAGAALILFLLGKLAKTGMDKTWARTLVYVLAGIAAAMGAAAAAIGIKIATGEMGQTLQGGMFAVAGAAITAAAIAAMVDMAQGAPKMEGTPPKQVGGSEMMQSGNPTLVMYVCGGAAIAATAVSMMAPHKVVDSSRIHQDPGHQIQDSSGKEVDWSPF